MSSKTLKTAVQAIQKFYPLELADRSWDNVGLLVDASIATSKATRDSYSNSSSKPKSFKILLTIDLTRQVAREAVAKDVQLVLSYHPFIFRGLKSITPQNTQQLSLLELIKNNVSVYSPHTSIDAANGGVNDWLVDGVLDNDAASIREKQVIIPDAVDSNSGMGRLVTLQEPILLLTAISRIKKALGIPHVQLGAALTKTTGNDDDDEANYKLANPQDTKISSIAVCAGSGGSVFSKLKKLPDLIYTGELSHHEVLAYREQGVNVVVCNHSNTERGYLETVKKNLVKELVSGGEQGEGEFFVEISEVDNDPLVVV